MVDYSKWDKFVEDELSSSCSSSDGEDGFINQKVEDGGVLRCESRTRNSKRRQKARVTRLERPTSVNFGGGKNHLTETSNINIVSSVQSQEPRSAEDAKSTSLNSLSRDAPVFDTKEKVRELRLPNLGCVTDDYAWEQTALTIDFYLKVPSKDQTGKRLPKLQLKEGMPPATATDCNYPASLAARSFNSDTEEGAKAFPLAHGITIEWWLATRPEFTSRFWRWDESKKALYFEENFPLPISDDEDTWLWTLSDVCPFYKGRCLHFHGRKKSSAALAGVTLWWDRLFSREEKLDLKEQLQKQSSPTAKAFTKAWEEAHQLFRDQIRQRKGINLDPVNHEDPLTQ